MTLFRLDYSYFMFLVTVLLFFNLVVVIICIKLQIKNTQTNAETLAIVREFQEQFRNFIFKPIFPISYQESVPLVQAIITLLESLGKKDQSALASLSLDAELKINLRNCVTFLDQSIFQGCLFSEYKDMSTEMYKQEVKKRIRFAKPCITEIEMDFIVNREIYYFEHWKVGIDMRPKWRRELRPMRLDEQIFKVMIENRYMPKSVFFTTRSSPIDKVQIIRECTMYIEDCYCIFRAVSNSNNGITFERENKVNNLCYVDIFGQKEMEKRRKALIKDMTEKINSWDYN